MIEIDLTPVLRDAYLRKVGTGPRGEPVELGFHVLRRVLGPRHREADRLFGLRFSGVRGAAVESVRWERDAGKWVDARADWTQALARREMEPPIIATATIGGAETLERLGKAADQALWLSGSPALLGDGGARAIDAAPVLFEATGEAILPSGLNANIRIFVASDAVEAVGPRGVLPLEEFVHLGEEWLAKWREYWTRKLRRPELPDDPQFDWHVPAEDDL